MPARPHPGAIRRAAPVELLRGLAVMAEPPTPEQHRLSRTLGLGRTPAPTDYSDVFLFQLYPYASVHLGPEGMMGGEAAARVAGAWRAVGYDPPAEPDHLAALLGLYAGLVAREGDASGADARLLRNSRFALLHEHLAPWVFPFLERVRDLTSGPYAVWAELLGDVLRREVEEGAGDARDRAGGHTGSSDALPVHLVEAPGLPDPRQDGAAAFVPALLAPVRSGIIVTRSDLARMAVDLDLGLRAGERRYALEHLFAQDASPVLEALATEADRQAARHDARSAWLGATARALSERARGAAALLRALATEQASAGAEASTGVEASAGRPGAGEGGGL